MKARIALFAAAVVVVVSSVATAEAGQIPIAFSRYNQDMVVEVGQTFSNTTLTATMDGGTSLSGNTWYQVGQNTAALTSGLPMGTTFTSAADPNTTFAMQSAVGNNAVLLNTSNTSATLNFTTPGHYSSLSFLTSSGNGAGTINYTIDYVNGTTSTGSITSPDWFGGSPVAVDANGRINSGGYDSVGSGNPNLYQENLSGVSATQAISSIALTWSGAGGGTNTAIFAISGTAVVPEPSTVVGLVGLAAMAGFGLVIRRNRRRVVSDRANA